MFQRIAQRADCPDGLPLAQLRAFFQIKRFFFRRDTREQRLPAGQCRQHQGAVMSNEFLGQALHIHRLLAQLGQLGQRRGTVLRFQRVRNVEQVAAVGDARHTAHHVGVDLCRDTGTGVQNGQRIAQGTVGQAGNELRTVRGQFQLFLPCDILHPAGDVLRPDAGEVVPLAAGKNGGRHLLNFGRGQNENDVGRRFFQRLQQGVEGRCGQHVHLVDDVYLILTGTGGVGGFVAQVADIVHAVVGSRVHLHHIEDAAVVDALANFAFAAGVAVDRMQTVDRLGENFCAGGLAGAAHAGEQIGVAHAVCRDLVLQGRDDGTLAHHVLKALGSPLAV